MATVRMANARAMPLHKMKEFETDVETCLLTKCWQVILGGFLPDDSFSPVSVLYPKNSNESSYYIA